MKHGTILIVVAPLFLFNSIGGLVAGQTTGKGFKLTFGK